MGKIQTLSASAIERIAAGEVVERPASIVKELIENSLDAQADSIVVEIEAGGKKRIAITDTGSGMDEADARACLQRHATSKLCSSDDLWRIQTLGFRGEALAAISAVARVVIETKVNDNAVLAGTRVLVHGGEIIEFGEFGCPDGTRIEVEELFCTTPARQKFLKSDQVEYGHIAEVFTQHALAHPAVRFELIRNGKTHLSYPKVESSLRRVCHVLGANVEADLQVVEEDGADISLQGYVGKIGLDKSTPKHLHIFVNGRPLRDRLLMHAVSSAYGECLQRGRYPIAVLFLAIDPTQVDVNVHPAKREVKFAKANAVHDFIKSAIRKRLGQREIPTKELFTAGLNATQERVFQAVNRFETSRQQSTDFLSPLSGQHSKQANNDQVQREFSASEASFQPSEHKVLGQLDASYIICESAAGELVIYDQHAAHERIGFDALKQQYASKGVEQQVLLIPENITLTTKETSFINEHLEILNKLGFELEPFGGETFLIKAVPAVMGAVNLQVLFETIALELEQVGSSLAYQKIVDHLFATMACHRQVRFGDRLSLAEMESLLCQVRDGKVTHCPHGRPVMIEIDKKEIERRFKRT